LFVVLLLEYQYRRTYRVRAPQERQPRIAEQNQNITYIASQTNHHIQIHYTQTTFAAQTNRAFVKFRPDGMSIIDGQNVSKITSNAAGDYTVHFARPMRPETIVCSAIPPTPNTFTAVNATAQAVRVVFDGAEPTIVALRFDD
jgi:hypothetical protein